MPESVAPNHPIDQTKLSSDLNDKCHRPRSMTNVTSN
jgi:hypothetical protein